MEITINTKEKSLKILYNKGDDSETIEDVFNEIKKINVLLDYSITTLHDLSAMNITGKLDLTQIKIGKSMIIYGKEGKVISDDCIDLKLNKNVLTTKEVDQILIDLHKMKITGEVTINGKKHIIEEYVTDPLVFEIKGDLNNITDFKEEKEA